MTALFVRLVFKTLFILSDKQGLVVVKLALKIFEQIILCLLGGQTGNTFQHFKLALFKLFGLIQAAFDFLLTGAEGVLFFLDVVGFLVERLLLLLEPALLTL